MRRTSKKYKGNGFSLVVVLREETGFQLRTIAFQKGYKGKYSKAMRDMLQIGINDYLSRLTEGQKREYDQIMENVKLNQQMEEMNEAPG